MSEELGDSHDPGAEQYLVPWYIACTFFFLPECSRLYGKVGDQCVRCPIGTYRSESTCQRCPRGSTSFHEGADECSMLDYHYDL